MEFLVETQDPAVIKVLVAANVRSRRMGQRGFHEASTFGRRPPPGFPESMGRFGQPYDMPDGMMNRGMGGAPVMDIGHFVIELINSHPAVALGAAATAVATAVDTTAKAAGSVAENLQKVLDLIKTFGELRGGRGPNASTDLVFRGASILDSDHRRDLVDAAMAAGVPIRFEP